jgi:hypothetical protein
MDRKRILATLKNWLRPEGLFCAYRYDFLIIYGPLRDYIEKEPMTRWADHRDARLIQYDDMLYLITPLAPLNQSASFFIERIFSREGSSRSIL